MLLRAHENISKARARAQRGLESFPPEGLGQAWAGEEGPGRGVLRPGQPRLESSSVAGRRPRGSIWVTLGPPSWTLSALLQTQRGEQSRNPPLGLQRSAWSAPPRPARPPPLPVRRARRRRYALSTVTPSSGPLPSAGRPLRSERPPQLLLPWPPRPRRPMSLSPRAPVCSLVAPSTLQNNHVSFFL